MNFIYFGTIFVVIGFSLNIGGTQIDLFPDAIGYFLILKGTQSLLDVQPNFKKLQPILYYLLGYNAVVFLDKIFSFLPTNNYVYTVFGAISLVLYFILFFRLFRYFDAFKPKLNKPAVVDKLNQNWLYYTYACVAFLVVTIIEVIYFIMNLGYDALLTVLNYFFFTSNNLEVTVTDILSSNQDVVNSIFIYIIIGIILAAVIIFYIFKVIYALYRINNDLRTV